jgi:hypothetical protein
LLTVPCLGELRTRGHRVGEALSRKPY